MKKLTLLFYSTVSICIVFTGCAASLKNLYEYKNEIKKYYEGGQYDRDLKKIINDAIDEFKNVAVTKNAVVIFDVDDTVISNYDFIKSMDFGNVSSMWHSYLNKAEAPVIPEVKRLYDFLLSRRIKIVFLTGRLNRFYESTFKNLINSGYTNFDTLITRTKDQAGIPAQNYKSVERLVLSDLGYNIIGCVGDQDSDLEGDNTGIKVKLPDYLYLVE